MFKKLIGKFKNFWRKHICDSVPKKFDDIF